MQSLPARNERLAGDGCTRKNILRKLNKLFSDSSLGKRCFFCLSEEYNIYGGLSLKNIQKTEKSPLFRWYGKRARFISAFNAQFFRFFVGLVGDQFSVRSPSLTHPALRQKWLISGARIAGRMKEIRKSPIQSMAVMALMAPEATSLVQPV